MYKYNNIPGEYKEICKTCAECKWFSNKRCQKYGVNFKNESPGLFVCDSFRLDEQVMLEQYKNYEEIKRLEVEVPNFRRINPREKE